MGVEAIATELQRDYASLAGEAPGANVMERERCVWRVAMHRFADTYQYNRRQSTALSSDGPNDDINHR